MPFTGDSFAHLFDWEKDPQRQEKIVNSRLEAEFDGYDTALSALAVGGNYLESRIAVGSAVALTNNVAANLTSLELTAGTWDISAIGVYLPAAATVVGNIILALNTTSATLPATYQDTRVQNVYPAAFTPVAELMLTTAIVRVTPGSTTTYYAVARAGFSTDTLSVYGVLRATAFP